MPGSATIVTLMLVNPNLEGDSFFWTGTGPNAQVGVLLSHGFCATAAEVRPLAKLVHAAGYTVAGPLLPGHKTTPDDLASKHWQDWVDAFDKTYRQLKDQCQQVVVGGESMGGLLALYHASFHPEVAAVLTYAPAVQLPASTYWGVQLLWPFVKEFKPGPGPRTQVDAIWQGYGVRPGRAILQLFRLMSETGKRFPQVQPPLLVVQGRLDTSIVPGAAQTLYDRAGSRVKELHWMADSTHCVILDKELPTVADLTLKFIAKALGAETL